MKAQKSIIKELESDSKQFEKLIKKLDNEILKKLASDYATALEHARDILNKINPKNLTENQVHGTAEEFQNVARMELKARNIELKPLN